MGDKFQAPVTVTFWEWFTDTVCVDTVDIMDSEMQNSTVLAES
jgi:hypothetical protein